MADIELQSGHRIRLRRAVCLDFGGIAKGFEVDKAATALQDAGIVSAIVNAGGDLRVVGEVPHPIHLRDPVDPQRLRPLGELADGALATSAPYFSLVTRQGEPRCALADPRSGRSITRGASYSVFAPSCAVADALTKALAVDGALSADCRARFRAEALVL